MSPSSTINVLDKFDGYVSRVENLLSKFPLGIESATRAQIKTALDGEPWKELRRVVSTEDLRASGIFFTSARLAARVVAPLLPSISARSRIFDPACGAGDLLLACTPKLRVGRTVCATIASWETQLIGRDLHLPFARITRARLALAAIHRAGDNLDTSVPRFRENFARVTCGCSLGDEKLFEGVTHILLNAPFSMVSSPAGCKWAGGAVNHAAVFMDICTASAYSGTRFAAVLPDVLRSGSRYDAWRQLMKGRVIDATVERCGQFDQRTDVHVFILRGTIKRRAKRRAIRWGCSTARSTPQLSDAFDVSVGAVVPHRDPNRGKSVPFLHAQGLARWTVVPPPNKTRRFSGTLATPPFVAVRRTSRPGERYRALATIVAGDRPIAVENHLIVVKPKDGKQETCRRLLALLRQPKTDRWFDQRIRCRHLTVRCLRQLPWSSVK